MSACVSASEPHTLLVLIAIGAVDGAHDAGRACWLLLGVPLAPGIEIATAPALLSSASPGNAAAWPELFVLACRLGAIGV